MKTDSGQYKRKAILDGGGGTAFPMGMDAASDNWGLTKLDFFAAAALQGILANPSETLLVSNRQIAEAAYAAAGAMMKRREEECSQ